MPPRSKRKHSVPQKKVNVAAFTKSNKIPITKLDAARRQLETAIILWFQEGDPVSIHLLSMAAHEILRAINKSRGGQSMLSEESPYIRPEYQEAARNLFLRNYEFFKHGARDAEQTVWFAPSSNDAAMLDAVETYNRIAQEQPALFRLFRTYMMSHHPKLFDGITANPFFTEISTWSKGKFFSELLPAAQNIPFSPNQNTKSL